VESRKARLSVRGVKDFYPTGRVMAPFCEAHGTTTDLVAHAKSPRPQMKTPRPLRKPSNAPKNTRRKRAIAPKRNQRAKMNEWSCLGDLRPPPGSSTPAERKDIRQQVTRRLQLFAIVLMGAGIINPAIRDPKSQIAIGSAVVAVLEFWRRKH